MMARTAESVTAVRTSHATTKLPPATRASKRSPTSSEPRNAGEVSLRQDEREETGLRAVLNYGHTFCHALETVTGYGQYLHGEAVSIGMLSSTSVSRTSFAMKFEKLSRFRRMRVRGRASQPQLVKNPSSKWMDCCS